MEVEAVVEAEARVSRETVKLLETRIHLHNSSSSQWRRQRTVPSSRCVGEVAEEQAGIREGAVGAVQA